MKTPKSFLKAFIGKGDDDLIQVKDADETLTQENLEEMARFAAEQRAQMHLEYTKQMAKIDAAAALGLAKQHAAMQQARVMPGGTLGPPGPSLPQPPQQNWPPGGMIPTPPQGIINKLFGDGNTESVHLSKEKFDERLRQAWHDGYEEGYDDAETYCMEKDEEESAGQWTTFADAVKAAGINPLTTGGIGKYNGVTLFESKGVSGGESLEGNEEQFTLTHIDKAVEAAKAVTSGRPVVNWQAAEEGGELGFTRGIVTHYKSAQLDENAQRSEEVHGVLGREWLRTPSGPDGVDGELSSLDSHGQGHGEESEGQLCREGIYEEAQEIDEARIEARNETDE